MGFYHIRSETNPADVLSKHYGWRPAWKLLQPLLFWGGNTQDLIDKELDHEEKTK
jgi:hypothetical protein